MNSKLKRPKLRGELRDRVAEYVLDFVRRNPGHQIPATEIGRMYAIADNQVTTVARQLCRNGKLRKASTKTYEIVDNTKPASSKTPDRVQKAPADKLDDVEVEDFVTSAAKVFDQKPFIVKVEALARDYYWHTKDDSVQGFVKWLIGRGTK